MTSNLPASRPTAEKPDKPKPISKVRAAIDAMVRGDARTRSRQPQSKRAFPGSICRASSAGRTSQLCCRRRSRAIWR